MQHLSLKDIRQNEKNEIKQRKENIRELLKKFSQHRGWKTDFLSQYPLFNNNEGLSMISNGHVGKTSNKYFLLSLELFDGYIETEQPEWYTKVCVEKI
jgi:hypothetical protein